jgi:chromosome segregation ATPase
MGLLDGFEKLINEHGSAVILKERIALANDKYEALEDKLSNSELRAEAAELRTKNLESELQRLELDNFRLKEQIRNLEEQLSERLGRRLENVREQLLQLLAAQTDHITAAQAAHVLRIGEQLATYHLTEMKNDSLVTTICFYGGRPTGYAIGQFGRAYLVSHGLLR